MSEEGAALTATSPDGFCRDNAGNEATPVAFGPIELDRTAPVIDLSVPANGAVYDEGEKVLAAYTCTDAVSGVDQCSAQVANGSPLDTANGSRSFNVVAIDAAGNRATADSSYYAAAKLGKTTTCDRYFTGTGKDVTVPHGKTCWLLPGTTVTHDLQVEKGAGLKTRGVTIGHDLELKAPSAATVCSTSVGHDLTLKDSAANVLVIGDTTRGGCPQGNTIGHDLLVEHNTGPVLVGDNQVGHSLFVKDNQPGGALVERNSAGQNAICGGNVPQEARANTAPGRLTCPT